MSRNDRRIAGKKLEKNKAKSSSTTLKSIALAELLKNQGMALKSAGKNEEAIPLLVKAVQYDPTLADVHFALAMMAHTRPALNINLDEINAGIPDKTALKKSYQNILMIMKKRRQYNESLVCQEQLCRLSPEDHDEKANLALLYNMIGRKENALRILAELIDAEPEKKVYKSLFISACGTVSYSQHEPLVKKALQSCFDNIYEANLYRAYSTWINIVQHDPACSGLPKAENSTINEDSFINWIKESSHEDRNFLQEKFFLDGIRLLTIADPILENFLRMMRRWLCLNAQKLAEKGELPYFESFIRALGEQCFYNEYIYSAATDETELINNLIETVKAGNKSALTTSQACALISCYQPLYKLFADQNDLISHLSNQSNDFMSLAKVQLLDPLEEKEIMKALKHFGKLENEVSKNVQSQYEENPYPRWISLTRYPTPNDNVPAQEQERRSSRNILIAGCGTGRHALGTAAMHPQAHVTAIDLSRASLAYAQRKANECGLSDRIDFIHADILSMDQWPTQFDIVESSGVLHHMEDPFRGWQVLNNLLKPGGYFKVGLYSELARQYIVEARKYVKNNGFQSTTEGIRACRESILKLPTNNPMRRCLLASNDFYATSLIRDLIFHVQEHRMNLLQIKEMMDKLGLVCTGFSLPTPETVLRYDKMFPNDPDRCNMNNWHSFEQKYPDTFVGMYQFWCQKQM